MLVRVSFGEEKLVVFVGKGFLKVFKFGEGVFCVIFDVLGVDILAGFIEILSSFFFELLLVESTLIKGGCEFDNFLMFVHHPFPLSVCLSYRFSLSDYIVPRTFTFVNPFFRIFFSMENAAIRGGRYRWILNFVRENIASERDFIPIDDFYVSVRRFQTGFAGF